MKSLGLALMLANAIASVGQHSYHSPVNYELVQGGKAGEARRDHPPASDTGGDDGVGRRVHIWQLA